MPALGRHSSFASDVSAASGTSDISTTSTASSTATTLVADTSEQPEIHSRKRPTPAQLNALQTTFDEKHYLTREERIALADAIGMELKAVTAWFQNRRQAAKRALTSKRAQQHGGQLSSRRHSAPLQSTLSLDHIASLAEKPHVSPRSSLPTYTTSLLGSIQQPLSPPMTPRRRRSTSTDGGSSEIGNGFSGLEQFSPHTPSNRRMVDLWQLIPSSPALPPSSPAAERKRFASLPDKSRSLRSLEFACAKAREGAKSRRGHDDGHQVGFGSMRRRARLARIQKTPKDVFDDPWFMKEEGQLPTPASSQSPVVETTEREKKGVNEAKRVQDEPATDVEAAMLLIGFKGEQTTP